MTKQYSITYARKHLAAIVRSLETNSTAFLTRRGKPVAVLISIDEHERLTSGRIGFWESYVVFQETVNLAQLDIEPAIFENSRT